MDVNESARKKEASDKSFKNFLESLRAITVQQEKKVEKKQSSKEIIGERQKKKRSISDDENEIDCQRKPRSKKYRTKAELKKELEETLKMIGVNNDDDSDD